MKRKTLVILLIIPFLLGILSFVTVTILTRAVAVDISDISWNYRQNEGFKTNNTYKLEATPVSNPNNILADGNDLIWSLSNSSSDDVAEIVQNDDNFNLKVNKEGEIDVTCSNEKKTVSKTFHAYCYDKGVIIVNYKGNVSGQSSKSYLDFGQYDPSYSSLEYDGLHTVASKIKLDIQCVIDTDEHSSYRVLSKSDNISFDDGSKEISFNGDGDAFITFVSSLDDNVSNTYRFNIVKDGVNVYNYNDLLMCTNKSSTGHPVIMQTSLGSLADVYVASGVDPSNEKKILYKNELKSDAKTDKLFGNYSFDTDSFSFSNEYYEFESKYHTTYIDEFNETNKDALIEPISKNLIAGIRAQKDFYGNGFTINLNNLAFPRNGLPDKNRNGIIVPDANKDYFHGPLPYIGIGDISTNPFVEAYAQDNVGLLLDGNNITLDNIRIQNSDAQNEMYNYFYTGTVLEVNGKNNTVQNSVLSNGKNIIRAFSTDGLTIDNSILKDSGEFLLLVGSNLENKVDKNKEASIVMSDGSTKTSQFTSYYDSQGDANDGFNMDNMVQSILMDGLSQSSQSSGKTFESIQNGLDNDENIIDSNGSKKYDAVINVKDTSFANSGVFSIGVETSFNGPMMYNGSPTSIIGLLGSMGMTCKYDQIGGTSYPIKLNITGNSLFYDWKDIDDIMTSALIYEQLSLLLASLGKDYEGMSIDDFFKVKDVLKKLAESNGYLYKINDKNYLNTAVVFYGGGLNSSDVEIESSDSNMIFSKKETLDMLKSYFSGGYTNSIAAALARAVLCVTGSHPFYFYSNGKLNLNEGEKPYLFDQSPSDDLRGGKGI